MADAVTSQTLLDSARNAVMKFTNISDGTGESAVTKVTVANLSGAPSTVRINKMTVATFGMGVDVLWDATTDVLAIHVPADTVEEFDFSSFGGIQNNAGSGVTGDIKFTTVGHSAADRYTIILELVK
jgi:hypothetical protein